MIPATISTLIILAVGVLYPAYGSYKTIRSQDIQSYLRWILYWIAYSVFSCAETFTDIFVSWFPFYYELKIIFVIWLVLPFTNGASIMFRFVILPQFSKWEKVMDRLLATLDSSCLTFILVFCTRSLHCIVDFVIEKSLMTYSKIIDYMESIKTRESGKVEKKPKRKATVLKMRKVDVNEELDLSDTDGELIARTTRANKYVYC